METRRPLRARSRRPCDQRKTATIVRLEHLGVGFVTLIETLDLTMPGGSSTFGSSIVPAAILAWWPKMSSVMTPLR